MYKNREKCKEKKLDSTEKTVMSSQSVRDRKKYLKAYMNEMVQYQIKSSVINKLVCVLCVTWNYLCLTVPLSH